MLYPANFMVMRFFDHFPTQKIAIWRDTPHVWTAFVSCCGVFSVSLAAACRMSSLTPSVPALGSRQGDVIPVIGRVIVDFPIKNKVILYS